MDIRNSTKNEQQTIVQLFESVFSGSEGKAEGKLIGKLARNLFEMTDEVDLFNFVTADDGQIIGSIFFSRFASESSNNAFILAPVAVQSDHQGKGIGQALIKYGLSELQDKGVGIVLTYGDPNFYGKVGFRNVSQKTIRPPFSLAHPEGWLGKLLGNDPIEAFTGSYMCVKALRDPVYW